MSLQYTYTIQNTSPEERLGLVCWRGGGGSTRVRRGSDRGPTVPLGHRSHITDTDNRRRQISKRGDERFCYTRVSIVQQLYLSMISVNQENVAS